MSISQADALAEMAEAYLASEPAASSAADRYQVVVHVSAETLRADETAGVRLHPVDTDRAFADWMLAKVPDLAIDEHTCAPEWHAGETIDWDLAVSLLFDKPAAGATRHQV